jgi:Flp pilus assembly protein TadB
LIAAVTAAALDTAALGVLGTTGASMIRTARRAEGPVWMTPRHPYGIAAGAVLVAASLALLGAWPLAAAVAVLGLAGAAAGAWAVALTRELRRRQEQQAGIERATAEWGRIANGGGS